MQVGKFPGEVARPEAVQKGSLPPSPMTSPSAPHGAVDSGAGTRIPGNRRADEVEISDAGRTLASGATGEAADQISLADLDPSRADGIRAKILSGAYHTTEMAEQVARAILRSGDL